MNRAVNKRFSGAIRWRIGAIGQAHATAERGQTGDTVSTQKETSPTIGAPEKEVSANPQAA